MITISTLTYTTVISILQQAFSKSPCNLTRWSVCFQHAFFLSIKCSSGRAGWSAPKHRKTVSSCISFHDHFSVICAPLTCKTVWHLTPTRQQFVQCWHSWTNNRHASCCLRILGSGLKNPAPGVSEHDNELRHTKWARDLYIMVFCCVKPRKNYRRFERNRCPCSLSSCGGNTFP